MKKIIIRIIMLVMFISILNKYEAYAFELNDIVEREVEELEVERIQKEISKNTKNYNLKDNIKNISMQTKSFSIKDFFKSAMDNFLKELKSNISIMGYIIVVSMLSGLIKALTDTFKEKSIGEISQFVIYIIIIGVVLISVNDIRNIYSDIVDTSTNIMKFSVPTLTGLLLLTGKIKTAAFFEPITFIIINIITFILIKVVMPIINILITLIIINYISSREILKEFIEGSKEFLKTSLKYIVGFTLGLSYISKVTAGVFDGTVRKAIGATLNTLIPVVGSSMESISSVAINAVNLVKNSTGIAIIVGMILSVIAPLIKLVSIIAIYKITVVIIEQIADDKIKKCLKDVSEVMSFVLTVIVMVQVIYILDITMIFSY